MAAIAGAAIGVSLLDVLGFAPGLGGKLTPMFISVLLLYFVSIPSRIDSIKYIVRRVDRSVDRLRTQSAKTPAPAATADAKYRAIPWKGITFRSVSEIKIAKTLDHLGIFFVGPSKVRFTMGRERQSRELDFIICHQGRWGILEVDGPFHAARYDQARDEHLAAHGIQLVAHFDSDRCHDDPQGVIREFLAMLESSSVASSENTQDVP